MVNALVAGSLVVAALGAPNPEKHKPDPSDELRRFCSQVLDLIGAGDAKAFDLMRERSVGPAHDGDPKAVAVMHNGLGSVRDRFGPYLGHELVKEQRVNESLRKYVYAAKLEKNLIRFIFIFYRPKSEWRLLQWHFDCNGDTADALFK